MHEYKLTKNAKEVIKLKNVGDLDSTIPFDNDNRDYQDYLKWLAKGNKPLNKEGL